VSVAGEKQNRYICGLWNVAGELDSFSAIHLRHADVAHDGFKVFLPHALNGLGNGMMRGTKHRAQHQTHIRIIIQQDFNSLLC
jgi:hypothetical protein